MKNITDMQLIDYLLLDEKIGIILVGLPATGKSTIVDSIKKINNKFLISSNDNALEELAIEHGLNYNEAFKRFDVTKSVKETFKQWVGAGESIIVDKTNMSKKTRKLSIHPFICLGYRVIAINVICDEETRIKQDQMREMFTGKRIPPKVIDDMKRAYQEPEYNEGFENIYNIDSKFLKQYEQV